MYKATYVEVVSDLQSMLTTRSPYIRPEKSRNTHPFVQTEMPEVRRDKFDEGKILSKEDFATKAIERESPFLSADRKAADALPEDLKLAIDFIAPPARRSSKTERSASSVSVSAQRNLATCAARWTSKSASQLEK